LFPVIKAQLIDAISATETEMKQNETKQAHAQQALSAAIP
jgi:hypothetical protein